MEEIPSTLIFTEGKKNKPWDFGRRSKYMGGNGLTPKDAILSSLRSVLNTYPSITGAETLAKSVVGMLGIENMNIDFLAATLYLYNIYRDDFSDEDMLEDIKPEMFDDSTATMKTIKEKLDKIPRLNIEKGNEWIRRKINILAYLRNILTYLSKTHLDFVPSQAYEEKEVRARKEQKQEEEEVEQEVEDDEAETGNIDEDSDFDTPDEGDEEDEEVLQSEREELSD
jgi:gas vesicle protein